MLKTMKIDFANLKLAYQEHKEEFDQAILKVCGSAKYIMGPEIVSFEEKLSEFIGVKHAISCASGTDALLLAMMAINIQHGDEVITTPFTFIATGEMIALLGAKPVFVDIEEDTYNINASKIEEKITSKTKAIMPVSLYGQVADMDEINQIAERHKLTVIEDAAQSFGATYKNKKSCNLSHIACTSFFPAKPLGCFGDGGAIFTNSDQLADKIKSLRVHGQTRRYQHKYIGIGGRMDTLQAAILDIKLKYYEKDILARQKVGQLYDDRISSTQKAPIIKPDRTTVWAQYSIRVPVRDKLQQNLKEEGIPTAIHYPKPLHLQECFDYLSHQKGDFPIAEAISEEILSLPMNPYLKVEEIDYIADQLKRFTNT